jgi:erythromycin esterase
MARDDDAGILRSAAIPLIGPDPDLSEDDLIPVITRLSGARLAGLGEATHGDHESFQLKRRFIQALVRRSGFRLVVIERGVAEMDAYDRYVTGGTDALSIGEDLFPWVTAEMRGLLIWLREQHRAGTPVRFAGMDMQSPQGLSLALRLLGEPLPQRGRRTKAGYLVRGCPHILDGERDTIHARG